MIKKICLTAVLLITIFFCSSIFAGTIQLPQTGQTICYDGSGTVITCDGTGQDGDIRAGVPWPNPRFTDKGDQTVLDNLTGLIWAKDGNVLKSRDPGFDTDETSGDGMVTWQHALDYIKKLNQENYLGYSDWRLPNTIELESLIHLGQSNSANWLNTQGFFNVELYNNRYWSSSTYASQTNYAWALIMTNSESEYEYYEDKSRCNPLWPARSGQSGSLDSSIIFPPKTGQTTCYAATGSSVDCAGTGQDGELQMGVAWPNPRFTDQGDQTLLDNLTGLIWVKDGNILKTRDPSFDIDLTMGDGMVTWKHALDYIKKLNQENYLGHNDWRLPNGKELRSLSHLGQSNSANWLNMKGFSNVQWYYGYWSSSSDQGATVLALSGYMFGGVVHAIPKAANCYVWPVRSGQSMSLANLVISKSGGGAGTVFSTPSGINCGGQCSASFSPGMQVALDAQADAGSTFTGWSGGGCQGTGSCQVTMDTGASVTAFFVQKNSNSVKVNIASGITGESFQGASVSLDGQTLATDAGGAVIFTGISLGQHDIVIQKSGFEPVTTKVNVGTAGINKMTWSLIPVKTNSKPVVTDVTSYYTSRDKKAFFLDGVDFTITFTASVNWNGKQPGQIRFTTPRHTYNETSGSHAFNMGADFGPSGRLQVTAVSADGVSSDPFDSNIEVIPKPFGADVVLLNDQGSSFSYSFKVGISDNDLSVIVPHNGATVSADIPIFGGQEMSLGIKAQVSVNVGSDSIATYSFTNSHDNENPFKVAGYAFEIGWSIGGDVSFKYREDLNQWRFDNGYFKAGLSASKDIPAYYFALPYPLYLRATIDASLDASVGFTGWSEGAGWQLDGTVEPEVGGKVFDGIGLAYALCVEGYLGIDGSLLLGFPETPIFREAKLILSGGIYAQMLWFKYAKPLWEYTWSWPELSSQSVARFMLSEEVMKDIRILDWQPILRNYGNGLSGGKQAMAASRSPLEAIPGEQIIPGQTDVYPYSYPSLVSLGGDLLLVWVTDDLLMKTTNNRTSIVYSRYSNGQWSDAAKIGENGTADYYPALAPMTGGAVAVWQDTGMVLGDQASMADVMAQQEITVSLFNASANAWSAPTRLTANSYLDRSPLVVASGDKAITAWIGNEQNDMFGSPTKPNTIFYATFDGTTWSPAHTVATGIGAILKSALTYRGNTAVYVFTVDGDGDLSTLTDQELYVTTYDGSTWSAVTRLTEDSVQDTNPQLAYDANGDLLLVWYRDGKFQMAKNLDVVNSTTVFTPGLSSGAADFRLLSGSNGQLFIVWPDASPKGQDIYMAPYDPTLNVWGKGMKMTDTDAIERNLTAVQMANGNVAVVYNKVETVLTPRDVQVGGKIVSMNVPGPGKTDLCTSTFALEGDLAVKDNGLIVSPITIAPGASLTFNASIVNQGLKPVQNIAVDFYYGDPANGGALIGQRQTIVGPLAAGEESTVSVDWTVPQIPEAKDIFVVVDPDLSIEDKDRTNNVAHIAVFQPDLAVTQAYGQTIGPVKRGLTISVTNIGLVAAQNIPLVIKKDDTNGSLIYEELIDELVPGEKRDVAYEWTTSGLITADGYLKVYAEVNGDRIISESSYLNNTRTIQVLGAFPGEAANPGIHNGATNVSIRPQLSWQAASGATTYDLYLWKEGDTKPSTPSLKDVTGVAATTSFPLSPSTTYHWQIMAKNASGQMGGPEWTFTTGNILIGDLNDDKAVDLLDAILALQAIGGLNPSGVRMDYVSSGVDVNGDGKIGLAEVIYILQKVAGMR